MDSIGPVQLLVVGFDEPNFDGSILAELSRLKDAELVRIIDAIVVDKDADGVVTAIQMSDLTIDEAEQMGAFAGALIGLGTGDEDLVEVGALAGALAGSDGHILDESMVDVLAEIPAGTAAAVALLEHRWAIGLRDAIIAAGGTPLVDEWVHPLDLVAIGLLEADAAAAAG